MYRALGAFVSARDPAGDASAGGNAQLLASSCRLLSLASPDIISAVSVSVAVPSINRAGQLAEEAEELAAAHGLIAAIELANGRMRVRFLRHRKDLGNLSGRQ